MQFDIIIGNPPYGKNSNLAVEFLNLAATLSTNIHYVLPRTFRKESVQNRLDSCLHLMYDQTVDDNVFPGTIVTCYQIWQVKANPREPINGRRTHADFDFVDIASANVCIGRVGNGPCGKVFLEGFDNRSVNTHYFLKAKDATVIQKMQSLSTLFRKTALNTVGMPSLSKSELIKIYDQN